MYQNSSETVPSSSSRFDRGGIMMNPNSQEVAFCSQSSQEETSFVADGMQRQVTGAIEDNNSNVNQSDMEYEFDAERGRHLQQDRQSAVPNLQEAFYKGEISDSPSQDSVQGANFRMLQSDNLVESFSTISPNVKIQDIATVQDTQ